MLRPTKSAIVFVQQLGRGLRKYKSKEFVTVLDFIGNYSNNFMIPMALSDDRSYNKDTIRRFVAEGSRVIPGCSTINFDAIAKKKTYQAIDNVNFNSVEFISRKLAVGKRPHELLLIKGIIEGEEKLISYMRQQLVDVYQIECHNKTTTSVLNVLSNEFQTSLAKRTFENATVITEKDGKHFISKNFRECQKGLAFRKHILELVEFGLFRYNKYYGKITRVQACSYIRSILMKMYADFLSGRRMWFR